MPSFGLQSENNIVTLHTIWPIILREVILIYDFSVICGYRGQIEQNIAFKSGNSHARWPDSNHNVFPSLAVDVAPYYKIRPHIRWKEYDEFYYLAGLILGVARAKGFQVKWGGRFNNLFDPGHFELII